MSFESELARAELAATGIMAEHFGSTRFASAESFDVPYHELRDLIALAYTVGRRDENAACVKIMGGAA